MRVLGVDPGSLATGWGLVGGSASEPGLIEAGVIRLRGGCFAERLAALESELRPLVARLRPTAAAVESPFHGPNARSALQLAHARGVILATLASAGLVVAEYTPATVKKSVAGNGRAPKQQVRSMVHRLLAIPETAGSSASDVSDALAVALCHLGCQGFWARTTPTGAPLGRSRLSPRVRGRRT